MRTKNEETHGLRLKVLFLMLLGNQKPFSTMQVKLSPELGKEQDGINTC